VVTDRTAGMRAWQQRATPAERAAVARLGWAAQQEKLGPAGRAAMAMKGGLAVRDRFGRAYYGDIRWGRR
jgi:hypothetical protein